jgi:hypothetical protein
MTSLTSLRPLAAAFLGAALLLAASDARAQGWSLMASAGRTTHQPVPGSVSALNGTFGLHHEGARWAYLLGGVPFDSATPGWGALGLGARLVSSGGAIGLGADVAGHAYGFRDPATGAVGGGATLEAVPLLALERGPVRGELRSGLLHHASTFSGEAASRSVHRSDARLSAGSAVFRMTGEGRYLRAAEGDYPYLGVIVEMDRGAGALWAHAGKWLSPAVETPVWGVGARVRLSGPAEMFASVEQGTNDPLYRNAPRRSWSVGMSRRLGPAARSASDALSAAPAPPGAQVNAGSVTFRIPLALSGEPPAVGGEFTGWQSVPMARDGAHWSVTLRVPPGIYRYAFRTSAGRWFVPEGVRGRMDDGFGGVIATLIVPPPAGGSP